MIEKVPTDDVRLDSIKEMRGYIDTTCEALRMVQEKLSYYHAYEQWRIKAELVVDAGPVALRPVTVEPRRSGFGERLKNKVSPPRAQQRRDQERELNAQQQAAVEAALQQTITPGNIPPLLHRINHCIMHLVTFRDNAPDLRIDPVDPSKFIWAPVVNPFQQAQALLDIWDRYVDTAPLSARNATAEGLAAFESAIHQDGERLDREKVRLLSSGENNMDLFITGAVMRKHDEQLDIIEAGRTALQIFRESMKDKFVDDNLYEIQIMALDFNSRTDTPAPPAPEERAPVPKLSFTEALDRYRAERAAHAEANGLTLSLGELRVLPRDEEIKAVLGSTEILKEYYPEMKAGEEEKYTEKLCRRVFPTPLEIFLGAYFNGRSDVTFEIERTGRSTLRGV